MNAHSVIHKHNWRNIEGTGRYLLGHAVIRGHEKAPPIYYLPEELLDMYVDSASKDEIESLIDTLKNPDETLQKDKIEKIIHNLQSHL